MNSNFSRVAAAALGAIFCATAVVAQPNKTLTGEVITVSATVEAIEASTRTLTLKKADGTYTTMQVPPEATRFSSIKVGDTLKARYYENVVFRVQRPGEKASDSASESISIAPGNRPAGTVAAQRTITATIVAIDMKAPSVTITGPNGWKYTSRVEDRKLLAQVKVGDKADITWTEAMLVSFEQ